MKEIPDFRRKERAEARGKGEALSPGRSLVDLQDIDLGREEVKLHGIPIEYWEALVLAKEDNGAILGAPAEAKVPASGPWNPVVRGALHLALRYLRERWGGLARDLRGRLEESPLDLALSHSERVIGFILASEEERSLAILPRKAPLLGGEADEQIARVAEEVKRILVSSSGDVKAEAVRREASEEKRSLPPSPPAAMPEQPKPVSAAPLPRRTGDPSRSESETGSLPVSGMRGPFPAWTDTSVVSFQEIPDDPPDPVPPTKAGGRAISERLLPQERELLDLAITPAEEKAATIPPARHRDMSLAEAWSQLYREGPSRIEMWEALTLLSVEGDMVRQSVEELLQSRARGGVVPSPEIPAELFRKILAVRGEWGGFALRLRDFLKPLLEPSTDPQVVEMSFALLLSAPAGRDRARRWLSQPDQSRPEATGYARTVVRLAERRRARSPSGT
jgi:hypothetical protein